MRQLRCLTHTMYFCCLALTVPAVFAQAGPAATQVDAVPRQLPPSVPVPIDSIATLPFAELPAADSATSGAQSASQASQQSSTAPKPVPQNSTPDAPPQQTKRILGIVPNFRAVSTDVKLPPMTVKEKFMTATSDSFDYSSIFIPAVLAGYSLARNSVPEFGHGGAGYGKYLWHSALDQTSENYMVEFVFPAITREDNRYYTLGRGGFFKRTGYALSRAVITRTDSGRESFNVSEVVGAGASSALSTAYYPASQRTLGNVGSEWGLDIGIDAASFVVKEFWPDINRRLFHQKD